MTKVEKNFRMHLIEHFESTRKKNWSKYEVVNEIKDLWIYHLEKRLSSIEKVKRIVEGDEKG